MGQTAFTVTETFAAATPIDFYVNGRLQREGGSYDFTRNTSTNVLTTMYTVQQDAWVKVRVWKI